ncbi:sugar ABC transporter ATP-binding protein [Streptomyces sp. NBC_01498]|uniref:sugar ABC transporter ATP-binding protein n=1 Tax=Streptomyces sp. NBC_01498 TaxID=2975870 RepID=UPI002E7C1099|nr:sugar ABC transporter ATP-binding protein [Streptomyces sp. NBC_01498]WTL25338.1 sugar ABC transporter ATP-binding protein [Streptomyces sp. NBC_01498]
MTASPTPAPPPMPPTAAQALTPPGAGEPAPGGRTDPLVRVRGLTKAYGAIRALRGVDVSFRRGEIHGLVGANGAGKSTLIRCLAGLEQPDAGDVLVDGAVTQLHGPADAAGLGLAFIHQELNLVTSFTGSQNIMLGSHKGSMLSPRRFGGVPGAVLRAARRVGIDFPLDVPVAGLTVHQQWLVTIARALVEDRALIAMDEPTASLDAEEAAKLLGVTRELAASGVAVVFISHRLDEVTEVCDRVTAFKDGSVSLSLPRAEITREALVRAIVGHDVTPGAGVTAFEPAERAEAALSLRGIGRGRTVRDVSLTLHRGEALGIAGLVGSGRTELARLIFGADRPDSGTMVLDGEPYRPRTIAHAIERGVAYVPEERRSEALFLTHSVEENLHITTWHRRRLGRWLPFIRPRASRAAANATCRALGIKTADARRPVVGLSGGNQQKVVMGRWLATDPKILILDEPTRGVDVGARADIYARIRAANESGSAVLVISSEFEELLECDRVLVMAEGHIVGELTSDEITVRNMLRLCYA